MKSQVVWTLLLVTAASVAVAPAAVAHVAVAPVAVADSSFLVGVLESMPRTDPSESTRPRVRVAFRHTAKGWEAFPFDCPTVDCLTALPPNYPPRVRWTVSLAGLTLGTLTARTPSDFSAYAWIGLQDIISKGAVPTVEKPAIEYAGFLNEARYRPLLVTSGRQRPLRSSAGWKAGVPDPDDLNRVWPIFKQRIPRIDNCESATGTVEEAAAAPPVWRAPRKLELEIPSVWVARNGDALLRVIVREGAFKECDGPRTLPSQLWLLRRSNGQIRTLPGQLEIDRAELVMPLDFDDLLRDGHEEVLFMTAGYNRGGYVLYYDGFRKFLKYTWQYH
jgi:hypothetical protein